MKEAIAIIAFVGALASSGHVNAQEMPNQHHNLDDPSHFYSWSCCSQNDCKRATRGQVHETTNGYRVSMPDGNEDVVHYDDTRLKWIPETHPHEQDYHVCVMKDYMTGKLRVRCLYRPRPLI